MLINHRVVRKGSIFRIERRVLWIFWLTVKSYPRGWSAREPAYKYAIALEELL